MNYFWTVLSQKQTFLVILHMRHFHQTMQNNETWYNYSLRNGYKHWMGTQAVGHPYDLFLDRFKPKKDIFGDFADEYLVEA